MPYSLADRIRLHRGNTLKFCHPSSIAYRYISRLKQEQLNFSPWQDHWKPGNSKSLGDIDYNLLKRIVDETATTKPDHTAFAIHLRLGDILHRIPNVQELIFNTIGRYKLYEKYNCCRLYYGNHNDINDLESQSLIEELHYNLFDRYSVKSKLISKTADSDFCDLSNEHCMIPTQGGFGWLAGCINSGQVIWDIFDKSHYHPNCKFQIIRGKKHQLKIKK